jgi:hypothetical protein
VTQLNVLLTHQDAAVVDDNVRYLRTVAPEARFVVAHGGQIGDYERVAHPEKVFIDDPTLRAPPRTHQSYHVLLAAVHDAFVAGDPSVRSVYVFEWDHIVLRGDFERPLRELAEHTGAAFLGKTCTDRTATNWHHYTRYRRDPALLAHLRVHSVREDPARLYGTLGNGFWLSREALAAYAALDDHPACYGELYVPTILHHLGFRVAEIPGALYAHVRYEPEVSLAELLALKRAGAFFAHPVKLAGVFDRILAAPACTGSETCSTAASTGK